MKKRSLLSIIFILGFLIHIEARSTFAAVTWVPGSSTYDGRTFVEIQAGVGAISLGFPSASNPAGTVLQVGDVYTFGFSTVIPDASGPTLSQTDLSASPLTAGTDLVLRFTKAGTDQISFVAMLADASDLSAVGFKQISETEIEIRAKIVDPILSESNNPDNLGAAFGLIIQTVASGAEAIDVKGTVFVTDMHWLDLESPNFKELPQGTEDVQGMAAGLAAKGISSIVGQGTGNFTAFMPEAFFQFAQNNGADVTGASCLGYRAFVNLTGSSDGFFKLNVPEDQAVEDANFDIDGNGQPDAMWRYRIVNSTWSRQVLSFGKLQQTVAGDFNADGEVGFADFLLFVSHYGTQSGEDKYDSQFDLTQDGEVGFGDFLSFVGLFGK